MQRVSFLSAGLRNFLSLQYIRRFLFDTICIIIALILLVGVIWLCKIIPGASRTLLIKTSVVPQHADALTRLNALCPAPGLKQVFHNTDSPLLASWRQCVVAKTNVQWHEKQFRALPFVTFVSVDKPFTVSNLPNDPLFDKQWPLHTHPANTFAPTSAQSRNNIEKAWALAQPRREIVVAVLDTGVDYTHEDLKDRMWINKIEQQGVDGYDDDNNGCVDDIYGCDFRGNVIEKIGFTPGLGGRFYQTEPYIYPDGMGHGTLVAGIIAAHANNHIGIAGVSHHAKIMSVKFINQNNVANMKDAALAIRYAVDNGAHIINNSYGKNKLQDNDVQLLRDAIEYAAEHGVLFVAASGNFGVDIDSGKYAHNFYPANLEVDNIISVAALDVNDRLWDHSNFGRYSVDMAAPGVNIWSTAPKGPTSLFRKLYDPSGYLQTDGTSIATPFVSGTAALILSMREDFTAQDVKRLLLSNTQPVDQLQGKSISGGKLDIYQAVAAAAVEAGL